MLEYGYNREYELPTQNRSGIVTVAIYYSQSPIIAGQEVYVSITIGGLINTKGDIALRTERSIAQVGISGKNDFEVDRIARHIAESLKKGVSDIQVKIVSSSRLG